MNIPNKLTILRTIFIPVFIVTYLDGSIPFNNYIAAAVFIIASLTDFFDGYLARKYNLITNFGKFLDPLADKMLVNSALLCFLIVPGNPVPFWAVLIIILRDFIINGFRLVASDNNAVISADYWGKIKTAVQMVMVILVLFDFDNPAINILEMIFIYVSVALTILSLIDCFYKNRNILRGTSEPAGSKKDDFSTLVEMLADKGYTVSFAESCTGGMLASAITDIPGASGVLKQSVVTYNDDAKKGILGVSEETLGKYTAVSLETAGEMAEGVRKWADSDIGVSITGIAGPDGGDEKHPVGLVYIGINYGGSTSVVRHEFKGGRGNIRKQAVSHAVKLIIDTITG